MTFPATSSPITVTTMPLSTATIKAVCTAFLTDRMSFLPIALAITTLAPSAIPINKFRISPISGLFAPTAATATVLSPLEKLPTMAISDALNSCSRIAVAATGSAKRGSLSQSDPCSISILAGTFSIPIANTSFYILRKHCIKSA